MRASSREGGAAVNARTFNGASRLEALYDAQTGCYFTPDVQPRDWAAILAPPSPTAPLVGIVDTGVLVGHPMLESRIAAVADFTGEGSADRDGHGSEVAIALVMGAPDIRLLSAKVLAFDDVPVDVQARRIADGIRWAAETGAREVNVSVGFTTACGSAHEELCNTVREILDKEVFILVAGEATCPAECDDRILVIGEIDACGNVRSSVPPDFVHETWGKVRMIPWTQWTTDK